MPVSTAPGPARDGRSPGGSCGILAAGVASRGIFNFKLTRTWPQAQALRGIVLSVHKTGVRVPLRPGRALKFVWRLFIPASPPDCGQRLPVPRSGILVNAKSRKLLGFGSTMIVGPRPDFERPPPAGRARGGFPPAIPAEMPPPPKTRRCRAPLQRTPP